MTEASDSGADEKPAIAIGTNVTPQKYLFGFSGQAEVVQYLRMFAAKSEAPRAPAILAKWAAAQPKVRQLLANEAGIADTISVADPPAEFARRIAALLQSDLIKRTFHHQLVVAWVEIDKLVANQRIVNLDHVEKIKGRFPKKLTPSAVYKICLSPTSEMTPIQHLEIAPNVHTFSSESSDLRFLNAFIKDLTKDDLRYAASGGSPAAAILAFVGYGAFAVNAFFSGRRIVLANGFHRIYALREAGVTKAPILLQLAHNAPMEFPPVLNGLNKEYLLGEQRPVLMKDFFDDDLTVTVGVARRIHMVTVICQTQVQPVPD